MAQGERARPMHAPDIWPALSLLTVERARLRRIVLRDMRWPLVLCLLATFALGVLSTELVRDYSRQLASLASLLTPAPGRVVPR
jgi:hypothetical protein